ncbi:MAG TPA: EAL domain-containing protein [Clostridiaceae bacterium]|nr:EAL domain-containing protein [Clostridiaceae bacterium]
MILVLIGIFVRFIPYITKKHDIQNAIFLVIGTVGTLFFMISSANTGALTVWAVYILFLLLTVILDDRVSAILFTVICAVMQVSFWIAYPKVSVTIDGNQYLTRIIIIMLSYLIVRYLTIEYALKVKDYNRFAREKEILERISSSFISINKENAKEKIDNMFEMADEILEFSYAYIIEFGEDYENATILNTCAKNLESESFPFHPGMRVKTATLPMVKLLIDQDIQMICEDTTNIFTYGGDEQKDFFSSRGINSFFALPIKIDQKIQGIIVIEYNDRMDLSLAEGRLYLLKIVVNILGDAKKKILYEERLYNFAYFDEATKLANRNMLKKRLKQIINKRKGAEKIAVLNIKLENLTMINDTFGHSVGEQIIIKSATILKNLFEDSYNIARSSEENFVVILPTVENTKQIKKCANKILDSFSHPLSTETGIEALFVVVRIGISVYPDDGRDADTLLKNSDLALFDAKNTNEEIIFYTERLETHIVENTLLTNRLFKALQNEEFFLEFQPQISCATGKTIGVEALLRWKTDGNKRVSPERFIPILEQTGLIYDVGLWVLEQTLQEHNRLIAKGFPPLRFDVNLSVRQFQEKNLIPDFIKIIEESGVDPKYIELEITESLFFENLEDVSEKLYKLKELGVGIAIDDFGKGYSSLSRLNLIPFDRIKIDKDMIHYIDLETKRVTITEVIILLAKAFNARITAEGVETKEQVDFLKEIHCDEIQGHYYSKALSAEKLEEFLKRNDTRV